MEFYPSPQELRPHPPLRFPRQSPQSSTSAALLGSTRFRISANRNSNIHGPGHEPLLGLSQVRRSHGNRRKTHGRSDPTPLPTQGVDGCSMKSQSHFENLACSVAPRRLVSFPRTARNFTPLVIIDATTPRHRRPARLLDSTLQPAPAPRSCPHAIPINLPRPPQTRAASF